MLLSSTYHNLAESLLLFWSARLWTRFEYNHLHTSIHPGSCIYIQAHTNILHRYCDSPSLRLHVVTYRTCFTPTHTHIFRHTYTHVPHVDVKWPDRAARKQAIRLDSERWATLSDMTAPIRLTHTHAHTHTHTHRHWELALRSNMTAEIAAFINAWPFPPRRPVLPCPSLPFTVPSH